jgi:cellulase
MYTDIIPVTNVNDNNIACNFGFQSPVSSKVIDVKAGDKVGVNWGHIIGGAQSSNDADNPIAKSHKGPTMFYMYVAPTHSHPSPPP